MAGIQRFKDIEAWKEARKLTTEVYCLTEEGSFRLDYGLRDQLRRAAISIMANIAEGFDGGVEKRVYQVSRLLSAIHYRSAVPPLRGVRPKLLR